MSASAIAVPESGKREVMRPLDVCRLPLDGVHLIEASAGTGKTFNIAALFLRLILEARLPIQQILAVTFTKMATSELRARVEKRLRDARKYFDGSDEQDDAILRELSSRLDRSDALLLLDRALSDIDRASIFTIHGFAARAIVESAFEAHASFASEVLPDVDRLAYDAVVDFWSLKVRDLHPDFFSRLGGITLFSELEKVARAALVNVDTPSVSLPLEDASIEAHRAAEEGLRLALLDLRQEFQRSSTEAWGLLVSGRVRRNSFQEEFLKRSLAEWELYLGQETLAGAPPKNWARFRQEYVLSQTAKGKQPALHPFFAAVEVFGRAYEILELQDEIARARLYELCVSFVRGQVRREHVRHGTRSFDDLLLVLRGALRGAGGRSLKASLEKRYRAALIDEFQDTDPLQYEVFREIFAERSDPSLFLIGDPKQSIYAFRGADVLAYLRASADAHSSQHSLTTSYRSSPAVVAAQNALFEFASAPFLLEGIQYSSIKAATNKENVLHEADGAPFPGMDVVILDEGDRPALLEQAALEVRALLTEGGRIASVPISPKNVAVLCRTNRDAQEVQTRLRALGVPAVMHGDRSVFESKEAIEIRRLLRALLDPGHRTLVRAALATDLLGPKVLGVAELDERPDLLELWDSRLRRWSDAWRQQGFFRMMDAVFRDVAIFPRILGTPNGERTLTNLRHIVELLHQAESEEHLGALGLLRYLEACIADPFGHSMADVALQIRLESDEDAVTLTTIHKSKGLEYDIVVLPSLGIRDEPRDEPAFRTRDIHGEPELELRSRALAERSYDIRLDEHQAEALRVGYVGLTRARHLALVLLGKFHGKFSAFSHWVRDAGPLGGAPSSWEEPLNRLIEESGGSVRVREPRVGSTRFALASEGESVELTLPPVSAELPARLAGGLRTASFSSITRATSGGPRDSLLGRDRDGSAKAPPVQDASEPGPLARLHDFPKGAVAGEALHEVFEKLVWGERDLPFGEESVAGILQKFGISPEFSRGVLDLVETTLNTRLAPFGARLGDLKRNERAAEVEFHLSVASGEACASSGRLTRAVRSLECLPLSYREGAWSLDFQDIRGFLRGFIDLVFEVDGRVFVVDYKSNFLGENLADYDASHMERSMNEHHYHIQGLIYGLALARHARLLRSDYSHERDFGGIYYLFLRGLDDSSGSTGVYFFRPSEADMRIFEAAMEGS